MNIEKVTRAAVAIGASIEDAERSNFADGVEKLLCFHGHDRIELALRLFGSKWATGLAVAKEIEMES